MGLEGYGTERSIGSMSNWRLHKAHRSLFRGLAFPLFYFVLVAMSYGRGVGGIDMVDVFFLLLFGGLTSMNLLTFSRTHNRRYAQFPLREEDAARAIEKALDSKFLTYRKKSIFPPTREKRAQLTARYVIDMYPVSVVIAAAQQGTIVCIGPETPKTEEQMMMLTIAISNELAKGPSSETYLLGQVPSFQGLDVS